MKDLLWAGGRLDLPVRWAHILARAESGCMHCGNQSRATPVTHTFHAQEPTEPRVGKVAASSIKWKSAGRAVARAYFRVGAATSLRQTCQQRRTGGVTGTSPAITPLLRGSILRDKERERQAGIQGGMGSRRAGPQGRMGLPVKRRAGQRTLRA